MHDSPHLNDECSRPRYQFHTSTCQLPPFDICKSFSRYLFSRGGLSEASTGPSRFMLSFFCGMPTGRNRDSSSFSFQNLGYLHLCWHWHHPSLDLLCLPIPGSQLVLFGLRLPLIRVPLRSRPPPPRLITGRHSRIPM